LKRFPFKGKLLVCDMDGTLLNSKHELSDDNKAALEYFVKGGGLFTIATGRTADGIRPLSKQLPINLPVIVINGAQIYDFNLERVLLENSLEDDIIGVLEKLVKQFPELGIEIFFKGGVYITRQNDLTESHRLREVILPGKMDWKFIPKPWYKIVLVWENEKLKKVESFLRGQTGTSRAVFSERTFLDLMNVNTSKGSALVELTRGLGIRASNVIAMGDNLNDLEMIQAAGVGIAVGNANGDLKKHASFCTKNNDNHAAAHVIRWIEENMQEDGRTEG
jgi:Cof subfamily protein (haloacid dehalogenase superfamily)